MKAGRWLRGRGVLYSPFVMLLTRIDKTLEKLRSGELPAPPVLTFAAEEPDQSCSGCGEPLAVSERYYYVRGQHGVSFRFHLLCHEVWARFKRA